MSGVIRPATYADLDGLLALYRQLHPAEPPAVDAAGILTEIEADPRLTILVLEEGDCLIASTYLNVIPNLTRGGAPYAVIENVVVAREFRGRGYGRMIMAETVQEAWRLGCYKVMLMTGSRDPATHGFYRACGFDPDAKTAYLARPPHGISPAPAPLR